MLIRSLLALAFILLPSIVSACVPASPYNYPIRGAYLAVFFAAGVALALELFRFLATDEAIRRRLRFAASAFVIILVMGLILSSVFRSLETKWRGTLPMLPAGSEQVRC